MPATPSSTRGRLSKARTLKVVAGSRADVTATRTLGDDITESAELMVQEGTITMHAQTDGRLVVDGLTLAFGNIHLSANTVPPNGLDLMGVTLTAANQMPSRVNWTQDNSAAEASGDVRLLLDWSVIGVTGQILPLAQQKIDPVPMELAVVGEKNGKISVLIHAERDGEFWSWIGLQLADLRLEVEATE